MKSKFRKMFWVRLIMGITLYIILVICFYYNFTNNLILIKNPFAIIVFVAILFLLFVSSNIFEIFTLTICEYNIGKTSLIGRKKESFPIDSITSIVTEKARFKNPRSYISNGFNFSVLKFKDREDLIISPDKFENYNEIILLIDARLKL